MGCLLLTSTRSTTLRPLFNLTSMILDPLSLANQIARLAAAGSFPTIGPATSVLDVHFSNPGFFIKTSWS